MARVASQSVTSVLETRENPSSADGQSESYPLPFQIHEKEEEELNEKSERDSGINEEPLLTADQVWGSLSVLGMVFVLLMEKKLKRLYLPHPFKAEENCTALRGCVDDLGFYLSLCLSLPTCGK